MFGERHERFHDEASDVRGAARQTQCADWHRIERLSDRIIITRDIDYSTYSFVCECWFFCCVGVVVSMYGLGGVKVGFVIIGLYINDTKRMQQVANVRSQDRAKEE